jgi:DNA-binding PadR family transcriptional regulator
MRSRIEALEFALLGLLSQGSLHGYELRKRLIATYGPFRALSFSVLYPQLRRMLEAGFIEESKSSTASGIPKSKRSRIVYAITKSGRKRFAELASGADPDDWDDENFEVRFAFFSPTPPTNRVQILEGRHRRLLEKAAILRSVISKAALISEGSDKYLTEWRRHSLESIEREISWLEEMTINEKEN